MYEEQTTQYNNFVVGENKIIADVNIGINVSSAKTLTIPAGTFLCKQDDNLAFSCKNVLNDKGVVTLEDITMSSNTETKVAKCLVVGVVDYGKIKVYNETTGLFVPMSEIATTGGFTYEQLTAFLASVGSIYLEKTI